MSACDLRLERARWDSNIIRIFSRGPNLAMHIVSSLNDFQVDVEAH